MKTLVIGKGGREHAIVKALKLSPSVTEVHAIPGSSGMATEAVCHDLSSSDEKQVIDFVRQKNIDLVIIGPEAELASGLSDAIRASGALVFGPSAEAASLEASKIFAKEFMKRANVPTAFAQIVKSTDDIKKCIHEFTPPYVLKADGLAAGKGVFICKNESELLSAAEDIFVHRKLGNAGLSALLEQSLEGWELSYLVLTNGETYQSLPLAQDHKRLNEGDTGPNTGGMGVVAPLKISDDLREQIEKQVIQPSIQTIHSMGLLYRGVLYVGLMITKDGPKVLEYNVRFGDPEAQVLLPLLDGDWGTSMLSIARGETPQLQWKPLYSSCIVLAAEGYPDDPVKNVIIEGGITEETPSSYFLHAGTSKTPDGKWVTNGGRVLNAIGLGSSLKESLSHAYKQAEKVYWKNVQIRKDIGQKVLKATP
ncbi:MAG: phosphoribosylamine--glycine ligase [Bdellovibrionales bacterium]|nr:phosphoribosylamine--glycine ligase [Bdellovibrionales bacterium]